MTLFVCETCKREWASSYAQERCRNIHKGIGYENLDTKSLCTGNAKDPRFPRTGERRPDGSVAGYSWRDRHGLLYYFRHDPVGSNGYLI